MDNKRKPFYQIIQEYLYSLIAENINTPGYKLPSENKLSTLFNVSRITPKHALENMEKNGLVLRRKGYGSYIAEGLTAQQFYTITGITPPDTKDKNELKPSASGSKTVALIIPDVKSKYMLNILDGIQYVAAKHNLNVLVTTTRYDQAVETEWIKKLIYSVDGMIIAPVNNETYNREILRLSHRNFPIVLIDNRLKGVDGYTISSDNIAAAYLATEYFIREGKRHIGIITQPQRNNIALMERLIGYKNALAHYKIDYNSDYIMNTMHHYDENSYEKIEQFLTVNPRVDSLIALNYETGIKTINAVLTMDAYLTTDDIIIFDEEFVDIYNLLKTDINYIKQDSFQIGTLATKLILEQIAHKTNLYRNVKIPVKLCINSKKGLPI